MPDATQSPVLFLAFASVATDFGYLPSLATEAQALRSVLETTHGSNPYEVVLRENVTLDGLLSVFQDPRYRGRIVLFHYAGHANSYALLMEQAAGRRLVADAGGLAAFLATNPQLKFVFLNACATEGHVAALRAVGIPVVLATNSEAVHDEVAYRFAVRFYSGLAGGATIAGAYAEAIAEQQIQTGERDEWLWQLFSADDQVLKWRLPSRVLDSRVMTKEDWRRQENIDALRRKVEHFWINSVFSQSTQDFALLDLDIELHPELVEQPFADLLPVQDVYGQAKLSHIIDIFDEVNGSLLIVGEPGAGKTTALLTLAKVLLERAEYDTTAAVPVIFNLSSWHANKHNSLRSWLLHQFSLHYHVGAAVAARLLDDGRLALMLDGLDEVADSQRDACVEAIDEFQQGRQDVAPLVVCCRLAECLSLHRKLRLDGSVLIRHLREEQVQEYLRAAGSKMEVLSPILQRDPQLAEMVRSPLMLNIVAVGCTSMANHANSDTLLSPQLERDQLFELYVDRMFARGIRAEQDTYKKAGVMRSLGWLARNMDGHSLSIFAVEGLQPDWLASRRLRHAYSLGCRSLLGLVLLLACLLGYGLGAWLAAASAGEPDISFYGQLLTAVGLGLLWASAAVFASVSANLMSPAKAVLLTVAAIVVLFSVWRETAPFALLAGCLLGLPAAMAGVGLAERRSIVLVDSFRWSWRRGGLGIAAGAAAGIVVTWFVEVVLAGVVAVSYADLLAAGFLLGTLGMLASGLTAKVQIGMRVVPNQGFHRTAHNSVLVGATVLFVILVLGIPIGLAENDLQNGLSFVLIFGVPIGASAALWAGAAACLQHFVLRFLLHMAEGVPYRLVQFLDDSVNRIFLRRVGGSYIFIHRLLLEYFAAAAQCERSAEVGMTTVSREAAPVRQ